MPGRQLFSFWEGNRSQLLAVHILSSVAAVVPVPVGFDFGLDLLCTLTQADGNSLYAGRAFGVQVKSAGYPELRYGGLNARGEWKEYEVKWLYGQDQPIVLALVDINEWTVSLYSTVRMWWVLYQYGPPGEVVLVPGLERRAFDVYSVNNRYDRDLLGSPLNGRPAGDGYSYRVPLGKPIFEVDVKKQDAQEYRDSLRECLNKWVELDYRNIRHHQMGVPYTEEWKKWETNVPPSEREISHYSNAMPDKNIKEIMDSIGPSVTALLCNLRKQGQWGKVQSVAPFAEFAKGYGSLDPIGIDLLSKTKHETNKAVEPNNTK